jgi:hypothetical protein
MADEERIAKLQTALDELVEPDSSILDELEGDSLVSAQESLDSAVESYNETVARLEGKIEAEKAIEDLSPPEEVVAEVVEEESDSSEDEEEE